MAGKLPQRLTAEEAREKINTQGGTILFEKVLTSSDVAGTGRLVIPKSHAEAHFPRLEEQTGMNLAMTDTEGKKHVLRFRFWVNNQSRMYLLEHTSAVQAKYRMQAGDVLVFYKLPEGQYGITGRKGTKHDVSRKPPTRRAPSVPPGAGGAAWLGPDGEAAGSGRKRGRARGDSLKAKRMKQKAAVQEVQSLVGYWSGHSLPPRRDGVFRTVPASAVQEGDRVVAQYGAWSALVNLGGELFQAFFDTHEAAAAALQAALQSEGRAEAAAGGSGGRRSGSGARAAAAEPAAAEGSTAAAAGAAEAAADKGMSPGVSPAGTSSPDAAAEAPAGARSWHGEAPAPAPGAAQEAQQLQEAAAEPGPGKEQQAQQAQQAASR
ncbi:hypothetical protein ABPG75_003390 [Micractinium tetrahymenae]